MNIRVTYYNIFEPNQNRNQYSREVLDEALVKFCNEDFWVVKSPSNSNEIDLTQIIGKVTKSEFDGPNLIFYIRLFTDLQFVKDYLYKDKIASSWDKKIHFCLVGEGNIQVKNDCSNVNEVTDFNIFGMFISDTCAWYDNVVVEEQEEVKTDDQKRLD